MSTATASSLALKCFAAFAIHKNVLFTYKKEKSGENPLKHLENRTIGRR